MDARFWRLFGHDLEWIRRQMEEMTGRPVLPTLAGERVEPGCFLPATDVFESPSAVHVRMDLPGLDRDAVSVVLDEGILTISGRRDERLPDGEGGISRHQMEIDYGYFARRIRIAMPVREGTTRATYKDGVLEIRIEKAPAFRGIPVKVEPAEAEAEAEEEKGR